jgi:hypothetical protein
VCLCVHTFGHVQNVEAHILYTIHHIYSWNGVAVGGRPTSFQPLCALRRDGGVQEHLKPVGHCSPGKSPRVFLRQCTSSVITTTGCLNMSCIFTFIVPSLCLLACPLARSSSHAPQALPERESCLLVSSGGKHVTRARSWWKRGDVDAYAAQTKVVVTGQFFKFFPCNHFINIKKTILFPAKQKTAQFLPFFFAS